MPWALSAVATVTLIILNYINNLINNLIMLRYSIESIICGRRVHAVGAVCGGERGRGGHPAGRRAVRGDIVYVIKMIQNVGPRGPDIMWRMREGGREGGRERGRGRGRASERVSGTGRGV